MRRCAAFCWRRRRRGGPADSRVKLSVGGFSGVGPRLRSPSPLRLVHGRRAEAGLQLELEVRTPVLHGASACD